VNGFRQQINQAAEPFYRAAENVRLTPAEMSHVRAIPGWTEARDAVRQGPNAWRVQHLPDESVGFLNAVKKHFDQAAENSASKFNPARNKETQSTHEMQASAVRQIAEVKSVDYQIALQIQRQAREQFLDPLLQGPIGKLAKKDMTTQKAIAVLFPENPVPGTEGEIRNAVFALARQRPAVAEQLVRAHVEMVFNQAARDLQGGANQFAGAKFAVKLAGGAQQRENLRAAIEALPHGTARWEGFEQLLDIMQATGARQPKGSLTAFNQLEVQSMTSGGIQELASKGLSPGKWMSYANDTFKAWSLGRNLDSLAQIITDPRAGDALRQIVRIPPGSDRAVIAAGRLIAQLGAATTEQRAKLN
jgi:DNA-binding GntR family transcriptional regulator